MNTITIIYNNIKINVLSIPINMKIADLKKKIIKKLNIKKKIKMYYYNIELDDNKLVIDYNFKKPILIIDKKYEYDIEKIINYSLIACSFLFLLKK